MTENLSCVFFLMSLSAVLSSYLLGEVLNLLGKLGCFLCVLGSILLVIHAPEEQEVTSLQDMTNKLLEPGKKQLDELHWSSRSTCATTTRTTTTTLCRVCVGG